MSKHTAVATLNTTLGPIKVRGKGKDEARTRAMELLESAEAAWWRSMEELLPGVTDAWLAAGARPVRGARI